LTAGATSSIDPSILTPIAWPLSNQLWSHPRGINQVGDAIQRVVSEHHNGEDCQPAVEVSRALEVWRVQARVVSHRAALQLKREVRRPAGQRP
jgi:hypothetical protein